MTTSSTSPTPLDEPSVPEGREGVFLACEKKKGSKKKESKGEGEPANPGIAAISKAKSVDCCTRGLHGGEGWNGEGRGGSYVVARTPESGCLVRGWY